MSNDAFNGARKMRKERTREVPGDDLADDAEWFMESVDELIAVGLYGLTVDLVGPASIVSDGGNGKSNVGIPGPLKGFA